MTGSGSAKARSWASASFWLLATLVLAGWTSLPEIRPQPSGSGQNVATQVPPGSPSVLPRGPGSLVAAEAHRQKATRGQQGAGFAIVPQEASSLPSAGPGVAPVLRSDALLPAPARAFEQRAPPVRLV